MDDITARLGDIGLVPVVVLDDATHGARLADALVAGGLPCAEVTFRTPAAEQALRDMAQNPDLLVGAGTVLSVQQLDRALDAGAQFIVTPGFSPRVVLACQDRGVTVIPGVATATEVQMALDAGITLMKFFPAEYVGGSAALAALAAPYGMVRFVPTGGITLRTLPDYLALPSVHAVGGSWMVAPALVDSRGYGDITRLAAESVAVVRQARPHNPHDAVLTSKGS